MSLQTFLEKNNNSEFKICAHLPGAKAHWPPFVIRKVWSCFARLHIQVFKYVDFSFYTYLKENGKPSMAEEKDAGTFAICCDPQTTTTKEPHG